MRPGRTGLTRPFIQGPNKMNPDYNSSGFTLIEVMITLTILAILAAISIPMYRNYITESRMTECWNNLSSIKLTQEEFFLENNRYFPDPDGTAQTSDSSLDIYWTASEPNAERNFDYAVTSSGTGSNYTATGTGRGAGFTVANSESCTITK